MDYASPNAYPIMANTSSSMLSISIYYLQSTYNLPVQPGYSQTKYLQTDI